MNEYVLFGAFIYVVSIIWFRTKKEMKKKSKGIPNKFEPLMNVKPK